MTWTLPNILTVGRLIAAPAIVLVYLVLPRPFADMVALILFVGAAVTDWLDGRMARARGQVSKFGAMLDPIADKAMVVIALALLLALYGIGLWVAVPVLAILFREIFVSGLREFLGDTAGTLKVTQLAKWKTTVQMLAIAVLLAHGIFAHYVGMWTFGMDGALVEEVLEGREPDPYGLRAMHGAMVTTLYAGLALLWLAAILTLATGWDYFRKSMPYLRERP